VNVVEDIIKTHGNADLFLSSNSFAHIDDMKTVFKCLKKLLKNDGMAIIEVHYLLEIIANLNFDFIYHEHFTYYSISCFNAICKLFGLSLVDVEFIPVHSRSIRVYIKNTENAPFINNAKMTSLLDTEYQYQNLRMIDTFKTYNDILLTWKQEFKNIYENLIVRSKNIWGYGASGRATTLCIFADSR
jgi:2-polyprenyl-3-methyl-5-hydroxy-6-metoxy-1,4-benzoquinol methylase